MKDLIVRKYGGSSVSAPEQIRAIAEEICQLRAKNHPVIVVISAMGRTTDQLVRLSREITTNPSLRELDMLLSSGERISMALLAMALNAKACPAISFTGSQAGIFTNSAHSDAHIIDIRPTRVEHAINEMKVVVLAGFQGVCPETKEVTTLGRGGSDTTAVALAGYFKAPQCEILKDVDGIYSGDPGLVDSPRHYPRLSYKTVLDLTFWGAKVLHFRSVLLAKNLNVPLYVGLAHGTRKGTFVSEENPMYESNQVIAITSHNEVQVFDIAGPDLNTALHSLERFLKVHEIADPTILDYQNNENSFRFYMTASKESLHSLREQARNCPELTPTNDILCTVTVIGGSQSLPKQVAQLLSNKGIAILKMRIDGQALTLYLHAKDRETAIRWLHDHLI